ncbi:hypothetical protein [Edaphobacter dinghuensis]|uniref:Uncharacterized protein n=1 Tax=Edaphobacter dinghuensis TaxID=1560005 RepID=A0A917HLS8_9BACT|nr:hypothetical protein [Edaphobacter dinghuensis]GGG82529.1 hypothetical protein GCM10011585_27640 [Edaphobacter dinghuensis]
MIAAQFVLSGMWLQDADSISSGNSRLLMIFVGMVAAALIVQAIALVVMAIGAAKARKRVLTIVEEVRAKAMPALESTQDFIANTAPKMITLAENLVETSNVVRSKAAEFDATLSDVNSRARVQAARADDIVTTVLTSTAEAVNAVQRGINVPIREFNGLMNALKAGLDVLVGRSKKFGSGRAQANYRESNDIDL